MPATMLLVQLTVAGVLVAASARPARAADPKLRLDLEALSKRRVFFGHQSVGVNLLDGVRALAAREQVPIRVVEAPPGPDLEPGSIGHAFVGRNTDPGSKLRDFEQALASGAAMGAEIAMVKLCFVDVTADADVTRLLAEYQASMARVRAASPGTTLVHVTIPLTTVQAGLKGMVKRLLGRAPAGFLENARREEFNALLRAAYQGREPLFDLARIESTRDGLAETAEWKGRVVPALLPELTDDGGHLNRDGQLRAAREMVAVLASAPVRPLGAGGAQAR